MNFSADREFKIQMTKNDEKWRKRQKLKKKLTKLTKKDKMLAVKNVENGKSQFFNGAENWNCHKINFGSHENFY